MSKYSTKLHSMVQEIELIDTYMDRRLLAQYISVLKKRTEWPKMDRDKIIAHAEQRLKLI